MYFIFLVINLICEFHTYSEQFLWRIELHSCVELAVCILIQNLSN